MPLVFVATPLGNLRDITVRTLDVLRDARLIVAEDTRSAKKLLHALGLPGREIWSYREQNAGRATPAILERARNELVAVTTDAGMPGVSDPGSELVTAAREAGVAVEVLPGPSAAIGVALLSGFPLRRFGFEGFPPRASGARRERFVRALQGDATTIWYESPRRLRATLSDLAAVAADARVFLVREYTKLHEEQLAGSPAEILARLNEEIRGEVAFAIAPHRRAAQTAGRSGAGPAIDALLAQGHPVREVAKILAGDGYGDRRELYARASERKARRKTPIKDR